MSNYYDWRFKSLPSVVKPISCAECDELLDAYLDAELANVDVRFHYPMLWRHLQSCKSCAQHYHTLHAILQPHALPPSASSVPAQIDLPFLQLTPSPSVDQTQHPWQVHLCSALLGEPLGLRFSFSLTYLQNCLLGIAHRDLAISTHTDENGPLVRSLLQELIHFGERILLVKVKALFLSEQNPFVQLQATLASSHPLPARLQATLRWGAHSHTCAVSCGGEADLGQAPLTALQPGKSRDEPIFDIAFAPLTI